jgi:hypothetical protein
MALFVCVALTAMSAKGDQGHHQSGMVGRVNGGAVIGGPTAEVSGVVPDHVRVYSAAGELLVDVLTETQGDDLWHFEVFLKPGTYTVLAYVDAAPEDGGAWHTSPIQVTVEKKEFTEVELSGLFSIP